MKKILFCLLTFALAVTTARAHDPQKFSPEKFQADMEQYITKEAELTPEEAERFFPLYREMQQKQRKIYNQMKQARKNKPTDEASFKKAVEKRDCQEIEPEADSAVLSQQVLQRAPSRESLSRHSC